MLTMQPSRAGGELVREVAGEEGRGTQVDGEVPVPALLRKRLDLVGLELGGIVDEKGQGTERADSLRHKALHGSPVREIGLDDGGPATRCADAARP